MTFITITRIWLSQHGEHETHSEPLYVNPTAIATIRPIDVIVRQAGSDPTQVKGAEVVLKSRAAYTVIESAESVKQMAEAAGL